MRLFGTDGIRGLANKKPLNPEFITKIGKAISSFSSGKENMIVLGGDTRISTPMISSALAAGINSGGVNLAIADIAPTPVIAYLTKTIGANCGIVVSASHNPWYDNGIKFFNRDGFKFTQEEEKKLEEEIFNESESETIKELGKPFVFQDWKNVYISYLKSKFDLDLTRLKIVMDCANGATSVISPMVFESFGNKVIVINNNPDGKNINLEGTNDLTHLKEVVLKEKADLGIAFDGDGDRLSLIDEKGNVIDGDGILGILAKAMYSKNELNKSKIVVTNYSNSGLILSLKELNIECEYAGVGDRFVSEIMQKENLSLGGEKAGHIILSDYSTTGDGIITALKVIEVMKDKKLSEINFVKEMPQVLLNKEVDEKIPIEEMPEISESIKKIEEILDGQGKVFVRYSGTQNIIRVLIEGPSKDLIKAYAEFILEGFK